MTPEDRVSFRSGAEVEDLCTAAFSGVFKSIKKGAAYKPVIAEGRQLHRLDGDKGDLAL